MILAMPLTLWCAPVRLWTSRLLSGSSRLWLLLFFQQGCKRHRQQHVKERFIQRSSIHCQCLPLGPEITFALQEKLRAHARSGPGVSQKQRERPECSCIGEVQACGGSASSLRKDFNASRQHGTL